jgi:hypothetical protein
MGSGVGAVSKQMLRGLRAIAASTKRGFIARDLSII